MERLGPESGSEIDAPGDSGTAERPRRESVLIPSGQKMKSYACLRSLNRQGIHTVVASEHEHIPHFSSRFCSERVRLSAPPEELAAYTEELLEIARRPDVKTIVPIRECDVFLLAKYREAFEEVVSLATPPLDVLRTAHDRLHLAEAAEEAGVPVAETRLLSADEEWDTDAVVKPRYNVLTDEYVDAYPPGTIEEIKNVRFVPAGDRPDAVTVCDEMKHEPIVQDFIPQEKKHLYCALWEHGEPVATYQHEQLRQNSWVGGGGVYRVSTRSRAVEEAAYDLLSHLDWHGLACIEYVKDAETGEWKFLEINPRVWQSLPEAVRAGADFPWYYWLQTQGRANEVDLEYETGIASHIAYGEIAHLRSVRHDDSPFLERPSFAGTLWDIATSCVRHPRFDYIRLDDPGLFLSALRQTFSAGVTSSREYNSGNPYVRGSPSDESTDCEQKPAPAEQ